jgi:hypothetical protein
MGTFDVAGVAFGDDEFAKQTCHGVWVHLLTSSLKIYKRMQNPKTFICISDYFKGRFLIHLKVWATKSI